MRALLGVSGLLWWGLSLLVIIKGELVIAKSCPYSVTLYAVCPSSSSLFTVDTSTTSRTSPFL